MKIKLIVTIGLVITCVACSNVASEESSKDVTTNIIAANAPAPTETLPSFKVKAVDGSIMNLAALKGKKVVVNLWATWCPPCRAEIPSIEALFSKVDKQKVAFIMLSLDENFDLAKNFAKQNNMQLPVYYPAENLPAIFGTDGIPVTFIFDEDGKLIKRNDGAENYDTEEYKELLKS